MAVAALVIGLAIVFVGALRLFLLLCPTRMWPVLQWTLRPAGNWTQPYQVALVAENAVENGGVVGTWLGQKLFGRTVASGEYMTWPNGSPAYADVHLPIPWLATEGIVWKSEPFIHHEVMVKVYARARIVRPMVNAENCLVMMPTGTVVERDYVLAPTPVGWRVLHVYVNYIGEGDPTLPSAAPSLQARLFGLCGTT